MLIILVGGSCVGKTTIEKQLVKKGFVPLEIYTTRELREDDPRWVYQVGRNFNMNTEDWITIKGVNSQRYFIQPPQSYGGKYITSIIDVSHAKRLAYMYKGKAKLILLTRPDEDILKCLHYRGLPVEEVYDRYNQYIELKHTESIAKVNIENALATINSIRV